MIYKLSIKIEALWISKPIERNFEGNFTLLF